MTNKVAIVGIGQTYHKSKRPDVTQNEMVAEAIRAAMEDADMTMKDIDTVFIKEKLLENNLECGSLCCLMGPATDLRASSLRGMAD